MKKQLYSFHEEKGFILPSVLLLTTIVLLYFSSSLITYTHDVKITRNMVEQVKSQSLFQMAYTQYKIDNHSQTKMDDTKEYQFPDGHVVIKSTKLDGMIQLAFTIHTNNDFSYYVTKLSIIPSDEEIITNNL